MFKVAALLIVTYSILILYLRLSDNGDGKKKDISGWLLFGLMWPQIKQQIDEKGIEHKEQIIFVMLSLFMIGGLFLAYFITGGK